MKIRRARIDDLNELMAHGREFIAYHPAKLKWNPKHVRKLVTDLIFNHIVVVAMDKGKVIGGIGGMLQENPFDPDEVHLVELFWWVGEEYRKGRVGLDLFKAFEEVASVLKATSIIMTTTSLTPTLAKVYERKGYENYEMSYMRRL
jgi:GNAT superfamily N-acetyltransferase